MRKRLNIIFIFFILFYLFMIKYVYAVEIQSTGKVIEEGIYEIELSLDENKVIDISEGSVLSGANVQIWERCNELQQRFEIKYGSDGYYTIKSVKSKKYLDVSSASKLLGTNVQQYVGNDTDAQKWQICKLNNNNYVIISKCNELVLTIKNSERLNGTNVEVYKNNYLNSQQFKFKKFEKYIGKKVLEDGVYKIATSLDERMVLDISEASTKSRANIQIWEDVNVAQQKFYIKYGNDGYYTIKNINSGKVLDVASGETRKYTNVQQYTYNFTDAQKWSICKDENGLFTIISKVSDINLEVSGSVMKNGNNVYINIPSESKNQKFILKKINEEYEETKSIENGIYQITTSISLNMLLDISEGSDKDGANVQLWADSAENQQKFQFTYVRDGLYKIISNRTGKALTVSDSGTSYSSNVFQSAYLEKNTQLWRIVKSEDNLNYYIISLYNNRYLDVANGSALNGTNIRVYESNKTNSQKFLLEQKKYGIDVSHWQSTIDYEKMSKTNRVDFMIIRAGYGTTLKDREFEYNYSKTKEYNIPTGVYLYATAQSVEQTRKEVYFLLELLKGKNFELPIYYDVEAQNDLSIQTITDMCVEFYNLIKKAGYKPGIYASKYYFMDKINVNNLPLDCFIWVASYGSDAGSMPNDKYRYGGKYDFWQYTSKGNIDGINGNVDFDVRF